MGIHLQNTHFLPVILALRVSALTLADPKHLGPTSGTHPLGRWLSILHGYRLSVLHFPFGTAFHTVRLHYKSLLL